MSLVESLYKELLEQGNLLFQWFKIFIYDILGYSFEQDPALDSSKKKTMFSSDPNTVSTDQEEADIAKGLGRIIFLEFHFQIQQLHCLCKKVVLKNNSPPLIHTQLFGIIIQG